MSAPVSRSRTDRPANDPIGTFRLATAVIMGAYHGPRVNPGAGRLPVELGMAEPAWDELRSALDRCRAEWSFTGTAEQAKMQAPVAINDRLGNGYSFMSSPSSYRAILDPITDEVIGHDYGGWMYRGDQPVEAAGPGGSGVFATVFLCTYRVANGPR